MNARQPVPQPIFITLDGIDGVGKTTQIERLSEHLRSLGHQVLCVRDPGGTAIGAQLREILLDSDCELHRRTEAMLFMASRCEMIETILRPGRRSLTKGSERLHDHADDDAHHQQRWDLVHDAVEALGPVVPVAREVVSAAHQE